MLNYALLIAFVVGMGFFMLNGLGEAVKNSFTKVNATITLVEDINNNKGR